MSFTHTAMSERLRILFNKQLREQLSPDERIELVGLFLEPSLQTQLQQLVEKAWHSTGEEEDMTEEKRESVFKQIIGISSKQPAVGSEQWAVEPETPVIAITNARTKLKRLLVAASVLLIVGVGSYFAFFNKKKDVPVVAVTKDDVTPPVSNKARIVLSDGRTVSVDSLNTIADGSVTVTKDANGTIIYTASNDEVKYNTLVNPRGSQVATTTLADGTKVWLNAGSSIKYFASNAGRERNVEMTGEAYFEVAKDKQRPFIVKKGDVSVTVLGTHFNVNAYDDEENLKVTLLEGSVRVSSQSAGPGHSKIMRPGEQALVHLSTIQLINPDLEEVMAWKNGKFNFGEQASIETIMKQLERWYDIETKYEGKVSILFGGSMPRSIRISEVLKKIEKTGGVHFTIEGRTVIVRP